MNAITNNNLNGKPKVERKNEGNKSQLNNKRKLAKQHIKQEIIDSNTPINTHGTFKSQVGCVYNAVWKENYFPMTVDLYEPRGLKYMCTECCESFVTKLSILTHSMMHRKFFCIVCLLYCDNQQEMNKHLTTFHAHLIKLRVAEVEKNDEDDNSFATTSSEAVVTEEERIHPKLTAGRKPGTKNRLFPLRKKNKVETTENHSDTPGKLLKSRFGRCITVKTPNY